ncbi:MAG: hypothetical protein FD156_54 [Nitrospirae bacterium]|nr:MAG: hypothetical protein FD156_54 [Nitrospirota bacterium]
MDFGKLKYYITARKQAYKTLMLTLVDNDDEYTLSSKGLSELRKKRIMRLTSEAQKQGMPLGYADLNALLLTSVSTLKRDVNSLERQGCSVHLKGRRK